MESQGDSALLLSVLHSGKPCLPAYCEQGFTLLEMLVVMVIVGLLAGVTLPQMQKMAASVEIANQKTGIKTALEGLGYRSFLAGQPFLLDEGINLASNTKTEPLLLLPAGWRVTVPQPIQYAANGICSGGKIRLIAPSGSQEVFLLKPPLCRLESINETL